MPWRRRIPITSGGNASEKDSSTKSSRSKLQLDGSRFQAPFPSHQRGLSESHQRLRRGFQEQNGKHKSDGQVNRKKGVADDDGPQHHILGSGHQRNDNDDNDGDDSNDDGSNDDDYDKKFSRGGSSKSAYYGSGQTIESENGGEPNNDGNGSDKPSKSDPTGDCFSNDGGSATGGGSVASSTNGSSSSVGIAETNPGPATVESTSQSQQCSSVLSQSSFIASQSFSSSQLSVASDIVPLTTSGSLVLVAATSTSPVPTTSGSSSLSSLSSSQTIRAVISSPSTSAVPSTASASSTLLSTVTSPPIAITSFAPTPTAVPISPSNPSSPSSDLSRTSFVPIIGGIVGAVVAVSAVLLVILFCLRRRRKRHCAKVDSGFAPYKSFKDEKLASSQNGDPPPQILPPPMMRVFHRVSSLLMRTYPSERPVESRAQTPIHNPFAETTSFASSRVSWLSYVSSHTPLPGDSGAIEETMRSNPFDDPVDPSAYTQTLSSPLERVSSLLPGTTISERRRSTPLVSPPPENRFSMTVSAELSPQEDPDRFSSWTDRKTMSRHSAMKDSPLQKLSMELYPVDVGSSNDAGTHLTGLPR
ncbi:hypothetical protein EDD85DRAFT_365218 [Armillaria nabsnona]|nr:hypothetical protein EDD85DRAFT_365218 [Armillaria nabsnona]